MKCCDDVEEFCVKPQLLLTALLCRKQIDANGVIKEQIAGILTQDLCGLFCEKRIGNVEGEIRQTASTWRTSISGPRCLPRQLLRHAFLAAHSIGGSIRSGPSLKGPAPARLLSSSPR
jgi:hypothetical protein